MSLEKFPTPKEGYSWYKDMGVRQDYANFKPKNSKLFYLTCLEWCSYGEQMEEVITVDGETTICSECGNIKAVLKMSYNTPSFHHNPSGICLEC